jgi:hypothetical protein
MGRLQARMATLSGTGAALLAIAVLAMAIARYV